MSTNRTLNLTTAALVLGNLVPLAGVLYFDWTVFEVLLLFWAESLIMGAINVARIWTLYKKRNHALLLLFVPFFVVHYGAFTMAHLSFLILFFRPEDPESWSLAALVVPLVALTLSHVYSHYAHFIGQGEYREVDPKDLMTQPYQRIVMLHVAIVLGGWLVTTVGEPLWALVLLVMLKISFDVPAHRKAHQDKLAREEKRRRRAAGQKPPRDPVFKGWGDD